MTDKAKPNGECWCGCGRSVSIGAFFVQGHDKVGESAVVKTIYGDVPTLLLEHGFGPGGKNATEELRRYREEGGAYL